MLHVLLYFVLAMLGLDGFALHFNFTLRQNLQVSSIFDMVFEWIKRPFKVNEGSSSDGDYYEELWSGFPLGDIQDQVLHTCTMHAMTQAIEYRHLEGYSSRGSPLPFHRLSTQFLVDCTYDDFYMPMSTFEASAKAVYNEGILSMEDYSQFGLRGEQGWIPNHKIFGKTRYGVDSSLMIYNVGGDHEKYKLAREALRIGPIYIDFWVDEAYPYYTGYAPHQSGDGSWHAACAIGSGIYKPNYGNEEWYMLYANSQGYEWGDQGFGRVDWNALVNVWYPTALCERQHSRLYPPV